MAILRSIARHGMTKGAAFFYAVAVGAGANLVLEYVHRQEVVPVVAHETAAAATPATPPAHERAAVAPIVPRPEARLPETRTPEVRAIEPLPPPHPATASLPPVPQVKPLPGPGIPVALPQVPTLPPPETTSLPPSKDLPAPPLRPAALPSPSPAATSALPPADKPADTPADKPIEAMSAPLPPPAPPALTLGNPVSLLPPPEKSAADTPDPTPPKPVKPASGTGGLY